jgi:hypothetical protein
MSFLFRDLQRSDRVNGRRQGPVGKVVDREVTASGRDTGIGVKGFSTIDRAPDWQRKNRMDP